MERIRTTKFGRDQTEGGKEGRRILLSRRERNEGGVLPQDGPYPKRCETLRRRSDVGREEMQDGKKDSSMTLGRTDTKEEKGRRTNVPMGGSK